MAQPYSAFLTKAVIAALAIIVTIGLFWNFRPALSASRIPEPLEHIWNFNFSRDAISHSLSQSQCDVAFPRLFDNIDNAVGTRLRSGELVSLTDLNIPAGRCMLRVLIYEGEVRCHTKDGVD